MPTPHIDHNTRNALLEIFEAPARFFDRSGDDAASQATWSRCLRAMSSYQATRQILSHGPNSQEIVAEIEAYWVCEHPVPDE